MRRCVLHDGAWALAVFVVPAGVCAQQSAQRPESDSGPSWAIHSPLSYLQVHTGLTYTDNVLQSPDDKKGEALASVGFDVDYTHKGRHLDVESKGAINWVEYLENTYSGVTSGALNAKAIMGSTQDWLQWATWESFGQLNTDPLAAPNPINVENVNYLTTGPILNFGLGSENRLSFRGLYSESRYQKSPYDSHSYDVGASLSHSLSNTSAVTLDADSRRTVFAYSVVATDYDVRSVFLGYTAMVARVNLDVELGYTSLTYHGSSTGSPLMSLSVDRRISPSSTVYARAQVGFAADAESIRSAAGLQAPGTAFAATSSPNPIKQEMLSTGWDFVRPRTTLSVFGTVARQRYERQATLDQNNRILQIQAIRHITQTFSAIVSVQRQTQNFPSINEHVSQISYIAGLSKTFTRFGVSFRYQKFRRDGSHSPGNPVAVYDENRVGVYITYDLLGHNLTPTGLSEH